MECKFLEEVKKLIKVILRDGTTKELSAISIINSIEQSLSQCLPYGKSKEEIQAQIKEHIKNSLKFFKKLHELFLNKLIKAIVLKVIATQFMLSKAVSHLTDMQFIDKNILLQTTYYKTLTKRP